MSYDREQDEVKRRRSSPATFQSPTFDKDGSFRVNEAVGSASISPGGRDVVLASYETFTPFDSSTDLTLTA